MASSTYSDLNSHAGEEPSSLVFDIDSINKSIATICGTRKGSRVFRRRFGSYALNLVFDPMDERTVYALREELLAAIKDHEPRVVVQKVEVVPDYKAESYYVNITYDVPTLNLTGTQVNFNLSK